MERIKERLQVARQAVATLAKVVGKKPVSDIERDAAIQRFEYSFEATWKAAQIYLREMEGIEQASPKGVIRASYQVGLLDETKTEAALKMTDQRNLTVHTYNEALAQSIYARLEGYHRLMNQWLDALETRLIPPEK